MKLKNLTAQYSTTIDSLSAFFYDQGEAVPAREDFVVSDYQMLLLRSINDGFRSWSSKRTTKTSDESANRPASQLTLVDKAIAWEYEQADPAQHLFTWADFPKQKTVLTRLSRLLPVERWEYGSTLEHFPLPILRSYLQYTFMRLVHEGDKVLQSADRHYAAFHLGLRDKAGEQLYVLFHRQFGFTEKPWKFKAFCTAGSGEGGKVLRDKFEALPLPADYGREDPSRLIYEPGQKVMVSWRHIIHDHIERFPAEYVKGLLPGRVKILDTKRLRKAGIEKYRQKLRHYLRTDSVFYQGIQDDLVYSVREAIESADADPSLAVPIYYAQGRTVSLMLPLYLRDSHRKSADLALIISRDAERKYCVKTIYTTDMAYQNARLLGAPPSWLDPGEPMTMRKVIPIPKPAPPSRKSWDLPA